MKTIMLIIVLIFSLILNISLVKGYQKLETQLEFYTTNENVNFIWINKYSKLNYHKNSIN
jgi:hypothetical protein